MRLTRRDTLAALLACGVSAPALAQALVEGHPSPGGGLGQPPARRPIPDSRALIARSGLSGHVGFALTDQTDALIDDEPTPSAIAPASTLKAITAIYALDRLGPDHRFRTRVIRAGDMLVLVGGGDPVLDSDGLARLAGDLVAAGETSPARFAVWGGALPAIAEVAPEQDDHLAYNPAVSGMILNFNRVHLGWRRADGDWQLSLEARAARQSPRAYTVSAAAAAQSDLFTYSDDGKTEHWTIARSALGSGGSRWLPVRRPELYAGDVFQTLCRARGLVLPAPEVIDDLPAGQERAAIDSPPLEQILRDMLYHSTNLTAEVVGLHASGASDLIGSAAAMMSWLHGQGHGEGLQLADHSGLSGASRVTPRAMARLMSWAAPGLAPLLKSDPLAGDLPQGNARQPWLRAKTGTLNFVSNLAGYIETPSGRVLAFAILCNDPERRAGTEGQEQPAGVRTWTRQAKLLQRDLIDAWAARFD